MLRRCTAARGGHVATSGITGGVGRQAAAFNEAADTTNAAADTTNAATDTTHAATDTTNAAVTPPFTRPRAPPRRLSL